jgi:ADP-ribose pyrophosphatase YjhB (NUDIX family)
MAGTIIVAQTMIRVISVCVFRHGDSILVSEGIDTVKQERFARPLGGGVEQGETSAQAIVREIREELGQAITELRLLGVLENIFQYQGQPGHEVVFVYDARFVDESRYDRDELPMCEAGWTTPAKWRLLGSFGPECRLVPEGLATWLGKGTF